MSHETIRTHIDALLHPIVENSSVENSSVSDSIYDNSNHMISEQQTQQWKEQQQKQHIYQQQQQTRIHHDKTAAIKKTLLTKKLTREDVEILAQRDLDIKSGKARGKLAMKK